MKSIFISTSSFAKFSDEPIKILKTNNINYKVNDLGRKLYDDEILSALNDCDGVIAGTENYSNKILEKLPNLKVISRVGVGLDNIDLHFANKKNIKIYKTETTPAPAVAELTLGLILDLKRKISYQNHMLKKGVWKKKMGSLLSGKTLGVIGLGTIGKELIKLTSGFKLKYLANDLVEDKLFAKQNNIKYCGLIALLSDSDVVVIHLNLSEKTNGLIDHIALKKMKKNAILINTSRGEIINEKALVNALNDNIISGAGLDVFQEEPYNGPLLYCDNVITTPHIGAYAKEIRIKMELEATKNLIKDL